MDLITTQKTLAKLKTCHNNDHNMIFLLSYFSTTFMQKNCCDTEKLINI